MYGMFEVRITLRDPNLHRNNPNLDLQRQAGVDALDLPREARVALFSFPSVLSLP
jgi:hypothetical protein